MILSLTKLHYDT